MDLDLELVLIFKIREVLIQDHLISIFLKIMFLVLKKLVLKI